MRQPDPKIFDDLARVAGGAMNVFSSLREQILSEVKTRVEEVAAKMDLVPREDFDRLEMQVQALQKKLDAMGGAKKASTAKPAAKKTSARVTNKKAGKKK